MKADPTKNNLTGAKKKKIRNDSVIGSVGHAAANVGRAGLGTFNKAGSLAKSFNEAVLPINEVKRIAKGKGTKGDYAYTALSALPLIGRAGKVAGAASKMGTRGTRVSNPYATKVPTSRARITQRAKTNKNLRNQNTIKRATERAETLQSRNAIRSRPNNSPAAKRVEFESKALQKRKVKIEKLDNKTVRRMNTPSIKGKIKAATSTARSAKTSSQINSNASRRLRK